MPMENCWAKGNSLPKFLTILLVDNHPLQVKQKISLKLNVKTKKSELDINKNISVSILLFLLKKFPSVLGNKYIHYNGKLAFDRTMMLFTKDIEMNMELNYKHHWNRNF